MTGYGRGESLSKAGQAIVEVSSVNRKQAEVVVNLPRELEGLESKVRSIAATHFSRGRCQIRIQLKATEGSALGVPKINTEVAKAIANQLTALADELKLSTVGADITFDHILGAPGVFRGGIDENDLKIAWTAIEQALSKALQQHAQMRAKEGKALEKVLKQHVRSLVTATKQVKRRAPAVQASYLEQLKSRIAKAGVALTDDDQERLLRELVIFADRSDISEELDRLNSHFDQFKDTLASSEPIGRTLDFLAQEMNREINTIGSKANDTEISKAVVFLKTELEKFREQAQNVE